MRECAFNCDMDGIERVMSCSSYDNSVGLEALGVALCNDYGDIVCKILSHPGAMEYYNERPFSKFLVPGTLQKYMTHYGIETD